jgi:hypothetical protein
MQMSVITSQQHDRMWLKKNVAVSNVISVAGALCIVP